MNPERKCGICGAPVSTCSCHSDLAARIVATYRAAAPRGFDPQAIDADTPKDRQYMNEMLKTLMGQREVSGATFESEAKFQPLYTGLGLQNMDDFLFGTDGGEYEITELVRNPAYKGPMHSKPEDGGIISMGKELAPHNVIPKIDPVAGAIGKVFGFGGSKKKEKPKVPEWIQQTRKQSYGPQRGFLDIQNEANTAQRGADISDIANLGPKAREALRLANPDTAKLLDLLNSQATDELALGAQLDPSMRREVQQSVRGGQAARGLGYGTGDLFAEIMATGNAGQALRDNRRAFASSVLGLDQSVYGDPFMQILGRPMTATGNAQAFKGGPSLFNAESPYAQDIYNTNYNAKASQLIANANNKNALIGAGISALGNIGGSFI